MQPAFVHLSLHTEFTLRDSTIRIKSLVGELDPAMPAVAMTDFGNMFALVRFYRATLGAGIKPVAGVDAMIRWSAEEPPCRVLLLVSNDAGYRNLTQLISRAWQQGQVDGVPVMQQDWLFEQHEGIIVLSGGIHGDVGQFVLRYKPEDAAMRLQQWQATFGDRYYLELTRVGHAGEARYIQEALRLAREYHVPVVATNDVRFMKAEDFTAHDARTCIYSGHVLADPNRPRTVTAEQYLKSSQQMAELFADIPQALHNSVEIAKRCNITLHLGTPVLPDFPIPDGHTEQSYLTEVAKAGLERRLDHLYDRQADSFAETRKAYDERLEYELDVIIRMGFPGYFLIVSDFIRWARNNDVPVGPGRGSGAGSLVAYTLDITDLDPLAYDLLFERFLNVERVSMPDFDIDFCQEGRDRVIQYVAKTYGAHRVSQIITYGTMAARAVVRDVGRVMSQPYGLVDRVAKMVPPDLGMTLQKALEQSEDLRTAYQQDEDITELINLALSLEGLARNAGKHAGGVVIAPSALTDFTPLYCESDGSSLVTQFDKDDAEAVGLVKFDFLGLRTLTIIDMAVRNIKASHGEDIDINAVPLDDAATYQLLQQARTTAVFQLESAGMKGLIERLKPDTFEDIIALVALYRPGPLQSGMVDDFIDRKHRRKPLAWPHEDYQHESLRPVLEPTYGVILYQEQVMQIAQVLASYSLGSADILRRAMGKKKPEEMARQRAVFLEGAAANDIDNALAGNIFDLVEKFAGYGFNKSHSAAYALLSYQTAWLKQHYPAAFMCAVMSADMENTEKLVGLVEEVREMGLEVLPPDINHSAVVFTMADEKTVRYGLGAIKGVGVAVLEAVLAERDRNGRFEDLESVCRRVDHSGLNKRILESLVNAGAVDDLGENRATLFEGLGQVLQSADQYHRDQAAGQFDLFGSDDGGAGSGTVPLTLQCDWPARERLSRERDVLGLYLSGHPIDGYVDELRHFTSGSIASVTASVGTGSAANGAANGGGQRGRRRGVPAVLAGLCTAIRQRDTANGKLVFVTLDDRTERVEIVLNGDQAELNEPILKRENVLIVEGEVSYDDFNRGYRIRAREIYDLTAARARFARSLSISIDGLHCQTDTLRRVLDKLRNNCNGRTPVRFEYSNAIATARIRAGHGWRVTPSHELISELAELAGENRVELQY